MKDGDLIAIQARVFDLLTYLVAHSDRVIVKDELMDAVWPGRVITEAALTRAIMKARAAVGDDANDPGLIKTLYGKGYRFVAPVEVLETKTSDDFPASVENVTSKKFRGPGIAIGLVTGTVLIFLVLQQSIDPDLSDSLPQSGTVQPSEPSPLVEAGPRLLATSNSIAVLPFANLSEDPSNEYFSDGITEEILGLLARIPRLRVTSRSSVFAFKGRNLSIPSIASQLNVSHVLEGSVRQSGNELRISAQLIDAESDSSLWSQTYERKIDDVFAVQDEIASAVVGALRITLLSSQPREMTVDPDAYHLYLQGRYFFNQYSIEGAERAQALLRQALEIDPSFVPGWVSLASVYLRRTTNFSQIPYEDGIELANRTIRRALDLEPDNARANAVLGSIELIEWRFADAVRHIERAMELDSGDPVILEAAAALYLTLGRTDDAITLRRQSIVRDPLWPAGHHRLALALMAANRLDEAVASVQRSISLMPDQNGVHFLLGIVSLLNGDPTTALDASEREKGSQWKYTLAAIVYYELGRMAESDRALAELIDEFAFSAAAQVADVYAFRGEADLAFEWLDRAYEYRDGGLTFLLFNPLLASLHNDPRWEPLLEKIGLLNL